MTTHYDADGITVHHGDCLDVLRELPDASVDAVVTDPPYGLEFMGKEWDGPWKRGDDVNADAGFNSLDMADGYERLPRPSFTGSTNPKCLTCGGTRRGRRDGTASRKVCTCDTPRFPNVRAAEMRAFGEWCEAWAVECLRVLKPGGHMLAFGGTRTWHRLACAVEDAGFEVRDSIAWMYATGFPKSLDVSKAIDKRRTEDRAPVDAVRSWLNERRIEAGYSHDAVNKHFGHASNGGGSSSAWMTNPTSRSLPTWEQWLELKRIFSFAGDMDAEVKRLNERKGEDGDDFKSRDVLSERETTFLAREKGDGSKLAGDMLMSDERGVSTIRITAAATDDARTWQGWGTALKPAFEPIVVARKPLAGTVAANVLRHGTGALNIDATRIGTDGGRTVHTKSAGKDRDCWEGNEWTGEVTLNGGRWPANVVLDPESAAELDAQSGESVSTKHARGTGMGYHGADGERGDVGPSDSGGSSRFFYVAADTAAECDCYPFGFTPDTYEGPHRHCPVHGGTEQVIPVTPLDGLGARFAYTAKAATDERVRLNGTAHPTVKPLSLMRWLVRLVCPPGGVCLDPFAGSGTTVEACILEGFRCVAIEREADYLPLIMHRIHRRRDPVEAVKATGDDGGLFDLLDGEASA